MSACRFVKELPVETDRPLVETQLFRLHFNKLKFWLSVGFSSQIAIAICILTQYPFGHRASSLPPSFQTVFWASPAPDRA